MMYACLHHFLYCFCGAKVINLLHTAKSCAQNNCYYVKQAAMFK